MLWTIDPTHAVVEFSVKHLAISTVKGTFTSFTASGTTDDAGLPTTLTMEIDAASISTGNEQRDTHLRSADFFKTEEFPTLRFVSRAIRGTKDDLTVEGDLEMRGVTKPVTLKGALSQTVTDPWGNQRTSLAVSAKILRSEWGLNWNQALEFGGFVVSDEVKLHVEAQAVAAVEEAVAA